MVVVSRRRDEFLYFSRRGEARSEKSRTMKFCDARYAVRLLESARRKSSYRAPASSVVTSSRFSTNDSITPPAKRSSPLSSATLIFPSLTDKFVTTSVRVYFAILASFTRVQEKYYYSTRVSDSIHSQFPSRNDYELTRTCIPFPFIKIDNFSKVLANEFESLYCSWCEIRNRVLFKKN